MSVVGIASIALGVLAVGCRGYSLVAPAPTLNWIRNMVSSNGRLRLFGAVLLAIGAMLVWAGVSEDTQLAGFITFIGYLFAGASVLVLLIFPGAYRAIVDSIMQKDTDGVLIFVRVRSLLGVVFGLLLIYFGVQAL